MAEVGNTIGMPKEAQTFAPDDRLVLPRCQLGLEFEYEGVSSPDKFQQSNPYIDTFWEFHREDSLKDHGAEYVYRKPMFGRDALTALEVLMSTAEKHKLKCNLRTGIHVHMDVRDLETSQLIGLVLLYAILEPLIFRWIGDNRENSIFCVPFYKADQSLFDASGILTAFKDAEKFGGEPALAKSKSFGRYAAFNLNAIHKFGSVEFRHMKTTHDFQRVLTWINILQSLKACTYQVPTSDGAIIALARNSTPNAFLDYVFGPTLARTLWCADAPKLIQEIGIPVARDLVLYGLHETPWEEVAAPSGKHEGFRRFLDSLQEIPSQATPSITLAGLRSGPVTRMGQAGRPRAQARRLDQIPFPEPRQTNWNQTVVRLADNVHVAGETARLADLNRSIHGINETSGFWTRQLGADQVVDDMRLAEIVLARGAAPQPVEPEPEPEPEQQQQGEAVQPLNPGDFINFHFPE